MKTNNNTHNENRNGMAFIINYAAELMNNGATVTTAQKYGVILREIRKDNEYVCLCASDFAKAAAIAADLLTATDDEDMNAANAATAARKAAEAQKKTSNNSASTRNAVPDHSGRPARDFRWLARSMLIRHPPSPFYHQTLRLPGP